MMEDLIARARGGDSSAREELLAQLRPYLRQWAEHALNTRFAGRVDASDVTQITLLDVHQKLEQFLGGTQGELLEWVRQALHRNVLDAVRLATAQKRHVEREQSADQPLPDGRPLRNQLPGDSSTPSMRAVRNEDGDLLQAALERLRPDQRHAVQLIHLEGHSIAAAAERLNRTPAATAKLLQRGVAQLRLLLRSPEES